MVYKGRNQEYFQLENIHCNACYEQKETLESPLTFVWFEDAGQKLIIDNIEYITQANEVFCLTEFHQVDLDGISKAKMIRFNRSFYCVLDHDSEVGCKGVLFFGASQLPKFQIKKIEKFQTIWKMLEMEIEDHDELQLEMLQSMLKRFIIMATREYKLQHNYDQFNKNKNDILREYNFLVEKNFKTKHTVSEYASILNKSPKTLANLFAKLEGKTPLQYIHERKLLEARRLLSFTDNTVKEIAYELGFEDLQSFSRFFKKNEGISPIHFKEQ